MLSSGSLTAAVGALASVLPPGRARPGVALWSRCGRSGLGQTPGERAGWWRARPAAVPAGPGPRAVGAARPAGLGAGPTAPLLPQNPRPRPPPAAPGPARTHPRRAAGVRSQRAPWRRGRTRQGRALAAALLPPPPAPPAAAPPAGPEVRLRALRLGHQPRPVGPRASPGSARAGQGCTSPTSASRRPGRHGHARKEGQVGVGASAGCEGARLPNLSPSSPLHPARAAVSGGALLTRGQSSTSCRFPKEHPVRLGASGVCKTSGAGAPRHAVSGHAELGVGFSR